MSRPVKAVIAVSLAFAIWIAVAPQIAAYLIVSEPLAKADAIMVLSGSAEFRGRTHRAAELYSRGVSSRVLLTDDGGRSGWSNEENTNHPFVELARRELLANGVDPRDITILPGQVSGTRSEAEALAASLDTSELKSVLLVTSPYHTRRTLGTFRKSLSGREIILGIDHSPIRSEEAWWLSRKGWASVGGEYVKSVSYWLTG